MRVPKKGSKKYKEVIDRGCGGHWTYSSNGNEFDCDHDYEWDCSDCPINAEIRRTQLEQQRRSSGG